MHWKEWLLEQRQKSGMVATKIPLKEVGEPWGMQADGSYGRSDSSFFKLVGLKVTANREVSFWHWPILEEAGGQGAVVVFRADNLYLISAKAEPGNVSDGSILLAPTLQASKSNLEVRHGGKRPPRAEILDNKKIEWVELSQDGGRFLGKTNYYTVVDINPSDVALLANERWFSREELREAYFTGEMNQHLIEALFNDFV